MYRISEAAIVLAVSESVVYELLQRGHLRSVRIGKRARRIPRAAMEEFVSKLEAEAEAS